MIQFVCRRGLCIVLFTNRCLDKHSCIFISICIRRGCFLNVYFICHVVCCFRAGFLRYFVPLCIAIVFKFDKFLVTKVFFWYYCVYDFLYTFSQILHTYKQHTSHKHSLFHTNPRKSIFLNLFIVVPTTNERKPRQPPDSTSINKTIQIIITFVYKKYFILIQNYRPSL